MMLWKVNFPFISISLFLILTQLPFGPSTPENPEEPQTPVKGWWMVSHFATPPTQYSKEGTGIIKAESVGSRSALFKEVAEKKKDFPILFWRWKVSNVVHSAIETRKDRFDAPARVMVIFGKEKQFRWFRKGEPEGLRIEYIWASHLPVGYVFDHPG